MEHKVIRAVRSANNVDYVGFEDYTIENELLVSLTVSASSTNEALAIAVPVARIATIFISSTRNLTLKTNSTSAPDDTLAISATRPYVWASGDTSDCPFTVDITAIYLTNATASSATVTVLIGLSAA